MSPFTHIERLVRESLSGHADEVTSLAMALITKRQEQSSASAITIGYIRGDSSKYVVRDCRLVALLTPLRPASDLRPAGLSNTKCYSICTLGMLLSRWALQLVLDKLSRLQPGQIGYQQHFMYCCTMRRSSVMMSPKIRYRDGPC